MKKAIALVLCLVLAVSFAACGKKTVEAPASEETKAPEVAATEAPAAEAPAEASADPVVEADPVEEMKELVLSFKDHPVDELYALIGEPISASYASSCLVQGGQDGVLEYDGFTVYTLLHADGQETVYDVE